MSKAFVSLVSTRLRALPLQRRAPQAAFWTILILLLTQLTACAAPPPPAALAAVGPVVEATPPPPMPTQLPTVTAVPTATQTAVPTATALPTEVPTATAVPLPRYDLVLVGGTLFDATGAPPREQVAVAVRDGRIAAIDAAGALQYSADTPVYDVRGATILPGFINAHAHIRGLHDDDVRLWARAGVTTVRDLAGQLAELVGTRDRMRTANDPTFPRLLVAGPIVTVEGGYPFAVGEQALRVEGLAVRDADDARAAVATLANGGADVIKLAVSGRTDVNWMELSDEQIAAITDTAHAHGLRVTAHVDRSSALRRAVLNGIDDVAHSPRDPIPDDLIALMVERGITLTPTIAVYEALAYQRGKEVIWNSRLEPAMYDNLRRFVDAGGTLALGDDYGGVPGMPVGMPMTELLHWRAAGLSPQQIIQASTRGSAIAIGRESELGTVEVGKVADLLVVQGNPLTDLSALSRPLLVVNGGRVVD